MSKRIYKQSEWFDYEVGKSLKIAFLKSGIIAIKTKNIVRITKYDDNLKEYTSKIMIDELL